MAYGLRVYSANDSVNPIFDSEDAFGFIELGSEVVATTGSTGSTFNITIDDGYSDIFYIYSPSFIRNTNLTNTNTETPVFTRGAAVDNGDGTKSFSLTVTWRGQAGNTATSRIGGGRVLIFGR